MGRGLGGGANPNEKVSIGTRLRQNPGWTMPQDDVVQFPNLLFERAGARMQKRAREGSRARAYRDVFTAFSEAGHWLHRR